MVDRLTRLADGEPIVLTGDFNCIAGEAVFESLTGDGAVDSPLSSAAQRTPETPHGPSTSRTDFQALIPDRKIDHVFVTETVTVGQHGVCSDCYDDGWFPSDHLPVVVELDLSSA